MFFGTFLSPSAPASRGIATGSQPLKDRGHLSSRLPRLQNNAAQAFGRIMDALPQRSKAASLEYELHFFSDYLRVALHSFFSEGKHVPRVMHASSLDCTVLFTEPGVLVHISSSCSSPSRAEQSLNGPRERGKMTLFLEGQSMYSVVLMTCLLLSMLLLLVFVYQCPRDLKTT